jgi:hypothetical protein
MTPRQRSKLIRAQELTPPRKIDVTDGEAIVQARLSGESKRSIARRLRISLADVNLALDFFSTTVVDHHTRLHVLAEDLELCDRIVKTYGPLADKGDVQAAAILAKFTENRRIMLGLTLPVRNDPLLLEAQTTPTETSTTKIERVLALLCGENPDIPPKPSNS